MVGSSDPEEPLCSLGGFGPYRAFLDRSLASLPRVRVIFRLVAVKAKEPLDPSNVHLLHAQSGTLRANDLSKELSLILRAVRLVPLA